jgi:hypothetical protein
MLERRRDRPRPPPGRACWHRSVASGQAALTQRGLHNGGFERPVGTDKGLDCLRKNSGIGA